MLRADLFLSDESLFSFSAIAPILLFRKLEGRFGELGNLSLNNMYCYKFLLSA
jgi:hypothetical protein